MLVDFSDGIVSTVLSVTLIGALYWLALVQLFRLSIKWLLCYKGWMYESAHAGKISKVTLLWFVSFLFCFCFLRSTHVSQFSLFAIS